MATTKARVKFVETSTTALAETEVNAVIEAMEIEGFVLDDAEPKILRSSDGSDSRQVILTFQHQDYAPGGTGSGGVPFKELELQITPTELTDAALTQALAFTGVPANALIIGGEIEVKAVGAGGGVASLTAQIGDTADPDEYNTAQDLLSLGHKFTAGAKLASGPALEAAYAPEVLITSDVNVDTLTGLDIYARLFYIDLPDTP